MSTSSLYSTLDLHHHSPSFTFAVTVEHVRDCAENKEDAEFRTVLRVCVENISDECPDSHS